MTSNEGGMSRRSVVRTGVGVAAAAGAAGLGAFAIGGAAADAAGPDAKKNTSFDWIIDCDTWDARPPSSDVSIVKGTTRKIVVHHMAYPNTTDYSYDHAIWLAQDCQNLHMDTNGWIDTGQHFTVSRGGYVLEGRHQSLNSLELGTQQVTGAHCVGENSQSIGIENEGTYTTETPTPMLWDSLVKLCVTVCKQYGIHAWNIFGHWDWNDTDCPGIAFYREFPKLRAQVAAQLGTPHSQIPARNWPDIYTSSAGATVMTLQYLLAARGYAVTPSGGYDSTTLSSVQDFQAKQGIEVASDGTVSQPTWETLAPKLDTTSTGDAVSAAQSILAHKGYEVSVTGVYDADTQAAVRDMQKLHRLKSSGIADTDTWCSILGGIVRAEFS